ncbi:MAG: SsrA-binding protein SmpB [Deltaproteobacteria bacterium]|nr:SsrA-binding protein SmpB [Deltaproteobacteria bacterium]
MPQKKDSGFKVVCRNKKASLDYQLEDRYEAGLVLTGTEVKSLRDGRANLTDAYARIIDGEAWLINAHISPYSFAHFDNHDPERRRKLLLHRKEIKKLYGRTQERGQSLIPLAIYFKEGRAKVELALARGKKAYDKRHTLKQKEADREMARALRRDKS